MKKYYDTILQQIVQFINFLLIIFFLPIGISCSPDLDDLIPNSLGKKKQAVLQQKIKNRSAADLFKKNEMLNRLLTEFQFKEISGGIYNYSGIKIHFGIAKFYNADSAYGVYSGLTAIPRERWKSNGGELSYKNPFLSGWKGVYVFWFYSPSNPDNYASFYKTYGETLLTQFEINTTIKINTCSYHLKFLPLDNCYQNSVIYIHSRNINGLDFKNTYSAKYQAGRNIARIYIEKMESEDKAKYKFNNYINILKDYKQKIKPYPIIYGGPSMAISWKDGSRLHVIYQYRWMIFMVNDLPNLNYANSFIRNIFKKMMKYKKDITPKEIPGRR